MPLYEHIVMMRPDVSGAQVETLTTQFKGVIEAGGGSIQKSEYWGLKVLSYRVKKNRKAHFSLMNI
ncbi:MAG: 30S ribosomal protein S6, partial [Rhizobiales bacterium]|nr:30S ribosomal protein S6 [Hyphomicrobiales bacterium]